MAQLRPQVHKALLALSSYSAVGGLICGAVADGQLTGGLDVRRLCTLSGIAQSRAGEVTAFLGEARFLGLVEQVTELKWRISDAGTLIELAPMLQAIQVYRQEVHHDTDTVEVVLTKPPNPSALTQALERMLLGTWGLLNTREVLPSVAEQARERFVVMTPFLDEFGGEVLLSLFENVECLVKKQLILRATTEGYLPAGYLSVAGKLQALGVEVYNFRLEKIDASCTETFHAKVVLADHRCAYVGSSNINKWSFQYSLELGLLVSGHAADRIGQIVDAIIKISAPVAY